MDEDALDLRSLVSRSLRPSHNWLLRTVLSCTRGTLYYPPV